MVKSDIEFQDAQDRGLVKDEEIFQGRCPLCKEDIDISFSDVNENNEFECPKCHKGLKVPPNRSSEGGYISAPSYPKELPEHNYTGYARTEDDGTIMINLNNIPITYSETKTSKHQTSTNVKRELPPVKKTKRKTGGYIAT